MLIMQRSACCVTDSGQVETIASFRAAGEETCVSKRWVDGVSGCRWEPGVREWCCSHRCDVWPWITATHSVLSFLLHARHRRACKSTS